MMSRGGITGSPAAGQSVVDWWSVGIFLLLMVLGWLNIYAAVFDDSAAAGFSLSSRYGSQLVWMGVSVTAAVVVMFIDRIYYHVLAYPFYFLMLLMLVATLFIGTDINGARSWLRVGGFSIQPAELGKLAVALTLARYMSSYHFNLRSWRNFVVAVAITVVPMGVVILQNDMGSAMVYASFLIIFYREGLGGWFYIALGMVIFLFVFSFVLSAAALLGAIILICTLLALAMGVGWRMCLRYVAAVALGALIIHVAVNYVAGIGADFYVGLLASSLLSLVAVVAYAWRHKLMNLIVVAAMFVGSVLFTKAVDYIFDNLQIHQQKRILNLLGVESDVQKWGYNVNQSKIAIGSGGFWGKGYLQGTQTKYDFVPEQSTDFIFCTVGEEWGFLGSTAVLALFCWLILRLIRMGERQPDGFGRIYCYGVAAILFFHVVINVGMAIGIMPVIGIPLPLFSYGGSSLLAFTILFFIAVKLDARNRDTDTHAAK